MPPLSPDAVLEDWVVELSARAEVAATERTGSVVEIGLSADDLRGFFHRLDGLDDGLVSDLIELIEERKPDLANDIGEAAKVELFYEVETRLAIRGLRRRARNWLRALMQESIGPVSLLCMGPSWKDAPAYERRDVRHALLLSNFDFARTVLDERPEMCVRSQYFDVHHLDAAREQFAGATILSRDLADQIRPELLQQADGTDLTLQLKRMKAHDLLRQLVNARGLTQEAPDADEDRGDADGDGRWPLGEASY